MTPVQSAPSRIVEFWNNKRVLVTGGAGFLGSFVVGTLRQRGAADVIVPRRRDWDLREPAAIQALLALTQPHVVIHVAGNVGGIGANRARPAEFFYDNVMMGVPLLHEAWRCGVEKFVTVGTVCSYPKHTPVPFSEDALWDGYPEETNAPYGLAKKMLLVQSQAYRAQYGFNAIYLLPVNLYGPHDNFDPRSSHVIPALIHKCLSAKAAGVPQIEVWGDGSATREFLYVADAALGIVGAAERYNSSAPVNLGSGVEISIRALAELIVELTGYCGSMVWNTSEPNGQPRRRVDTRRAQSCFGFEAQTPLRSGLIATIDWYRSRLESRGRARCYQRDGRMPN